jgi:hypothetical protein
MGVRRGIASADSPGGRISHEEAIVCQIGEISPGSVEDGVPGDIERRSIADVPAIPVEKRVDGGGGVGP